MKIETFENITTNSQAIEVKDMPKNSTPITSLLKLITPQMISTFTNTILPLLNSFNQSKTQSSKPEKNEKIVETTQYKEIKTEQSPSQNTTKNMDYPNDNPQLNILNLFNQNSKPNDKNNDNKQNIDKQKNSIPVHKSPIIDYNKQQRKRAIENKMEQHRRLINALNNK